VSYLADVLAGIAIVLAVWAAILSTRTVNRLRRLVIEHHAVGVMDGAHIGDRCPICSKEEP